MRAPHLGGGKLIRLLAALGGIEALLGAGSQSLARAGLDAETVRAIVAPDPGCLAADLAWLEQPGHDLVTWDQPRYPALLRDIDSPPAALFAIGDPEILWQPQIAVIGSRNPTGGGLDNARSFSQALSRRGLVITSGMAAGIDACAHQSALDAGGLTIAVAGTGLDRVYPAGNRALAARIGRSGVLVSEFPLGTPPRRGNFPTRNRIISGLSLGVLVIEAGLKSGTLNTARQAAEQGREVFALPGSIHNPMAKGCHRLIREGVKLVETDAEILQELAPLAGHLAGSLRQRLGPQTERPAGTNPLDMAALEPQVGHDPDYQKLLTCLGHDPRPVDALIQDSGLTPKAVSAMLLLLELKGEVEKHPGGVFSRRTRGH